MTTVYFLCPRMKCCCLIILLRSLFGYLYPLFYSLQSLQWWHPDRLIVMNYYIVRKAYGNLQNHCQCPDKVDGIWQFFSIDKTLYSIHCTKSPTDCTFLKNRALSLKPSTQFMVWTRLPNLLHSFCTRLDTFLAHLIMIQKVNTEAEVATASTQFSKLTHNHPKL